MSVIPFSWPLDLELNRIRTLYGGGDDPVMPYEPPSTVIKVSRFQLGMVSGIAWRLQFEHTKIYEQSFYGQQEKTVLLLDRESADGNTDVKGTVGLYDLTTHKRLSEVQFDSSLANDQCTLPIPLDLTMCELSYAVFENSRLCVQGSITIVHTAPDNVDSETVGQTSSSEIHVIKNNPLVQLSHHLIALLDEGAFSDVTIKCESSEIRAHKNIMSARSPVFAAMFKSSMLEGAANELVISDMEVPVLEKMLKYVYGSQVRDLDIEMACDLLFVSDKYQLSGLLEICVEYLKSNLSTDNALHVLRVADLHEKNLKQFVLKYISDHFSFFESEEGWKELKEENSSLAIEVLEHTVKLSGGCKRN